jgi:hypothetical protein
LDIVVQCLSTLFGDSLNELGAHPADVVVCRMWHWTLSSNVLILSLNELGAHPADVVVCKMWHWTLLSNVLVLSLETL